jgi:hypothetical protein
MYRVIYASRATVPMRDRELEELLVDVRMRNEEDDLTGLLCYFGEDVTDEPGFLQVLEGDRDAVEATYARISRDRRHRGMRRVSAAEVSERMFPDWRMGLEFVTHEDLARAVPGLSGNGRLVVMAELVNDPVRAEQILVGATY